MSQRSRRSLVVIILLLLLLLALLLLVQCEKQPPLPEPTKAAVATPPAQPVPDTPSPATPPAPEVLTAATVMVPEQVAAGAAFRAAWTGPDNVGDYLTVVRPDAPADRYENYRETKQGASLELTAPIETGDWEVRYVTARSRTILGKAALKVMPVSATLTAPDEAVLGSPVSVAWTGPNNKGDYITIVPKGAPADRLGKYADTDKGSPVTILAPVESGEAEIRYISGQGRKILGQRPLKITTPETTLAAPASVTAGKVFSVAWQGPDNKGDYITIVPQSVPDGQYRNYAETRKGSPLELKAPIEAGDAEIRYMTGSEARVLARRAITVEAAAITLAAPEQIVAGSSASIVWTGPDNSGDYITIVPAATPDGQYAKYADAKKGSPLNVVAPIRPGAAEIRYMSGQGAKVLGRRAIDVVPAQIKLDAPSHAAPAATVMLEWTGPNNGGDYLTLVAKGAKDGAYGKSADTARGSPAKLDTPKETGDYEIRYMSGQDNLVLARVGIQIR